VNHAPLRPHLASRCVRGSAPASHVVGGASTVSDGERATTRERVVASGCAQCLHGRQHIGGAEVSPRRVRAGRPQRALRLCCSAFRLHTRPRAQTGSRNARGRESHVSSAAKARALVASFGFRCPRHHGQAQQGNRHGRPSGPRALRAPDLGRRSFLR